MDMKKTKKIRLTALVLTAVLAVTGVVLAVIGLLQVCGHGTVTCEAVITNVKTDFANDGHTAYSHRYYGTYTVDGQTYQGMPILQTETATRKPDHALGQTVQVQVTPGDADGLPSSGVWPLILAGVCWLGALAVVLFGRRAYRQAEEKQKARKNKKKRT